MVIVRVGVSVCVRTIKLPKTITLNSHTYNIRYTLKHSQKKSGVVYRPQANVNSLAREFARCTCLQPCVMYVIAGQTRSCVVLHVMHR